MRRSISSVLCAVVLAACAKSSTKPEVHLYTWDSYDDPAIFAAFEEKTGLKVVVDYYGSNEELLAKLMGGKGGYDVIMPSDYMVDIMARQGLLAEVPADAVPNRKHLDPRFMNLPFDKGNRYSFPYLWGLTGIAYDSDVVKPAPDSWNALWDPKYKGRIVMLNDQREVIAMTLHSLGKDPNSRDPKDLEAAKRAVPKEGAFLWMDNLALTKAAPNPQGAIQLMDYLLDPEVAVKLHQKLGGGTPLKPVAERMPAEARGNPTIVPTDAVIKKARWLKDVGEAAPAYDRLWTELKAG
ncbi:MAG: spermidine/putrescine transport system substrate-binding protein [Elusimicrobia bacterium]|nr:MAG: spermidine/putrescine transport system substrate-binding protein [Elusimicrobiota bacterium]